jgi:hypothetical protein
MAHYKNGAQVQEGDTVKLPDGSIGRVRWESDRCLPGSCNGNSMVRLAHVSGPDSRDEICAGLLSLVRRQPKRRGWTFEQIKEANKRAGKHFFERGAMRFFRSRLVDTPKAGPGGVYFVTSEEFVDSSGRSHGRFYSVTRFNPRTGGTDRVGKFNVLSKRQALLAARLCAIGGRAKIARALGIK